MFKCQNMQEQFYVQWNWLCSWHKNMVKKLYLIIYPSHTASLSRDAALRTGQNSRAEGQILNENHNAKDTSQIRAAVTEMLVCVCVCVCVCRSQRPSALRVIILASVRERKALQRDLHRQNTDTEISEHTFIKTPCTKTNANICCTAHKNCNMQC